VTFYTHLMLSEFEPVAFIHTSDLASAQRFYVERLGLELIEESPIATVVRAGRITVRITPVEGHKPVAATVLGWTVPNIEQVVKRLTANDVPMTHYPHFDQDRLGIWNSPGGARVAWFTDPDGNTLSVTQLLGPA
jgi:catechol 2,3-dioxygenase-like lactoylglutathione lyase family enzyme